MDRIKREDGVKRMKKASMLLLSLVTFAAGAAQAGNYSALPQSDCPGVSASDMVREMHKAGAAAGLDLPKDMALRAELQCTPQIRSGKTLRYVYTIRAAIEKQLADGETLRWAPVAQLTGHGTAAGSSAVLRQVGFTVRDVIRQEP
jgi:hypothetical protein